MMPTLAQPWFVYLMNDKGRYQLPLRKVLWSSQALWTVKAEFCEAMGQIGPVRLCLVSASY